MRRRQRFHFRGVVFAPQNQPQRLGTIRRADVHLQNHADQFRGQHRAIAHVAAVSGKAEIQPSLFPGQMLRANADQRHAAVNQGPGRIVAHRLRQRQVALVAFRVKHVSSVVH